MKVTVLPDPINSIASSTLAEKAVALLTSDWIGCCSPPCFCGKKKKKIGFAQTKNEFHETGCEALKNTDATDGKTGSYQSTTVASLASTNVYVSQNGYIIGSEYR